MMDPMQFPPQFTQPLYFDKYSTKPGQENLKGTSDVLDTIMNTSIEVPENDNNNKNNILDYFEFVKNNPYLSLDRINAEVYKAVNSYGMTLYMPTKEEVLTAYKNLYTQAGQQFTKDIEQKLSLFWDEVYKNYLRYSNYEFDVNRTATPVLTSSILNDTYRLRKPVFSYDTTGDTLKLKGLEYTALGEDRDHLNATSAAMSGQDQRHTKSSRFYKYAMDETVAENNFKKTGKVGILDPKTNELLLDKDGNVVYIDYDKTFLSNPAYFLTPRTYRRDPNTGDLVLVPLDADTVKKYKIDLRKVSNLLSAWSQPEFESSINPASALSQIIGNMTGDILQTIAFGVDVVSGSAFDNKKRSTNNLSSLLYGAGSTLRGSTNLDQRTSAFDNIYSFANSVGEVIQSFLPVVALSAGSGLALRGIFSSAFDKTALANVSAHLSSTLGFGYGAALAAEHAYKNAIESNLMTEREALAFSTMNAAATYISSKLLQGDWLNGLVKGLSENQKSVIFKKIQTEIINEMKKRGVTFNTTSSIKEVNESFGKFPIMMAVNKYMTYFGRLKDGVRDVMSKADSDWRLKSILNSEGTQETIEYAVEEISKYLFRDYAISNKIYKDLKEIIGSDLDGFLKNNARDEQALENLKEGRSNFSPKKWKDIFKEAAETFIVSQVGGALTEAPFNFNNNIIEQKDKHLQNSIINAILDGVTIQEFIAQGELLKNKGKLGNNRLNIKTGLPDNFDTENDLVFRTTVDLYKKYYNIANSLGITSKSFLEKAAKSVNLRENAIELISKLTNKDRVNLEALQRATVPIYYEKVLNDTVFRLQEKATADDLKTKLKINDSLYQKALTEFDLIDDRLKQSLTKEVDALLSASRYSEVYNLEKKKRLLEENLLNNDNTINAIKEREKQRSELKSVIERLNELNKINTAPTNENDEQLFNILQAQLRKIDADNARKKILDGTILRNGITETYLLSTLNQLKSEGNEGIKKATELEKIFKATYPNEDLSIFEKDSTTAPKSSDEAKAFKQYMNAYKNLSSEEVLGKYYNFSRYDLMNRELVDKALLLTHEQEEKQKEDDETKRKSSDNYNKLKNLLNTSPLLSLNYSYSDDTDSPYYYLTDKNLDENFIDSINSDSSQKELTEEDANKFKGNYINELKKILDSSYKNYENYELNSSISDDLVTYLNDTNNIDDLLNRLNELNKTNNYLNSKISLLRDESSGPINDKFHDYSNLINLLTNYKNDPTSVDIGAITNELNNSLDLYNKDFSIISETIDALDTDDKLGDELFKLLDFLKLHNTNPLDLKTNLSDLLTSIDGVPLDNVLTNLNYSPNLKQEDLIRYPLSNVIRTIDKLNDKKFFLMSQKFIKENIDDPTRKALSIYGALGDKSITSADYQDAITRIDNVLATLDKFRTAIELAQRDKFKLDNYISNKLINDFKEQLGIEANVANTDSSEFSDVLTNLKELFELSGKISNAGKKRLDEINKYNNEVKSDPDKALDESITSGLYYSSSSEQFLKETESSKLPPLLEKMKKHFSAFVTKSLSEEDLKAINNLDSEHSFITALMGVDPNVFFYELDNFLQNYDFDNEKIAPSLEQLLHIYYMLGAYNLMGSGILMAPVTPAEKVRVNDLRPGSILKIVGENKKGDYISYLLGPAGSGKTKMIGSIGVALIIQHELGKISDPTAKFKLAVSAPNSAQLEQLKKSIESRIEHIKDRVDIVEVPFKTLFSNDTLSNDYNLLVVDEFTLSESDSTDVHYGYSRFVKKIEELKLKTFLFGDPYQLGYSKIDNEIYDNAISPVKSGDEFYPRLVPAFSNFKIHQMFRYKNLPIANLVSILEEKIDNSYVNDAEYEPLDRLSHTLIYDPKANKGIKVINFNQVVKQLEEYAGKEKNKKIVLVLDKPTTIYDYLTTKYPDNTIEIKNVHEVQGLEYDAVFAMLSNNELPTAVKYKRDRMILSRGKELVVIGYPHVSSDVFKEGTLVEFDTIETPADRYNAIKDLIKSFAKEPNYNKLVKTPTSSSTPTKPDSIDFTNITEITPTSSTGDTKHYKVTFTKTISGVSNTDTIDIYYLVSDTTNPDSLELNDLKNEDINKIVFYKDKPYTIKELVGELLSPTSATTSPLMKVAGKVKINGNVATRILTLETIPDKGILVSMEVGSPTGLPKNLQLAVLIEDFNNLDKDKFKNEVVLKKGDFFKNLADFISKDNLKITLLYSKSGTVASTSDFNSFVNNISEDNFVEESVMKAELNNYSKFNVDVELENFINDIKTQVSNSSLEAFIKSLANIYGTNGPEIYIKNVDDLINLVKYLYNDSMDLESIKKFISNAIVIDPNNISFPDPKVSLQIVTDKGNPVINLLHNGKLIKSYNIATLSENDLTNIINNIRSNLLATDDFSLESSISNFYSMLENGKLPVSMDYSTDKLLSPSEAVNRELRNYIISVLSFEVFKNLQSNTKSISAEDIVKKLHINNVSTKNSFSPPLENYLITANLISSSYSINNVKGYFEISSWGPKVVRNSNPKNEVSSSSFVGLNLVLDIDYTDTKKNANKTSKITIPIGVFRKDLNAKSVISDINNLSISDNNLRNNLDSINQKFESIISNNDSIKIDSLPIDSIIRSRYIDSNVPSQELSKLIKEFKVINEPVILKTGLEIDYNTAMTSRSSVIGRLAYFSPFTKKLVDNNISDNIDSFSEIIKKHVNLVNIESNYNKIFNQLPFSLNLVNTKDPINVDINTLQDYLSEPIFKLLSSPDTVNNFLNTSLSYKIKGNNINPVGILLHNIIDELDPKIATVNPIDRKVNISFDSGFNINDDSIIQSSTKISDSEFRSILLELDRLNVKKSLLKRESLYNNDEIHNKLKSSKKINEFEILDNALFNYSNTDLIKSILEDFINNKYQLIKATFNRDSSGTLSVQLSNDDLTKINDFINPDIVNKYSLIDVLLRYKLANDTEKAKIRNNVVSSSIPFLVAKNGVIVDPLELMVVNDFLHHLLYKHAYSNTSKSVAGSASSAKFKGIPFDNQPILKQYRYYLLNQAIKNSPTKSVKSRVSYLTIPSYYSKLYKNSMMVPISEISELSEFINKFKLTDTYKLSNQSALPNINLDINQLNNLLTNKITSKPSNTITDTLSIDVSTFSPTKSILERKSKKEIGDLIKSRQAELIKLVNDDILNKINNLPNISENLDNFKHYLETGINKSNDIQFETKTLNATNKLIIKYNRKDVKSNKESELFSVEIFNSTSGFSLSSNPNININVSIPTGTIRFNKNPLITNFNTTKNDVINLYNKLIGKKHTKTRLKFIPASPENSIYETILGYVRGGNIFLVDRDGLIDDYTPYHELVHFTLDMLAEDSRQKLISQARQYYNLKNAHPVEVEEMMAKDFSENRHLYSPNYKQYISGLLPTFIREFFMFIQNLIDTLKELFGVNKYASLHTYYKRLQAGMFSDMPLKTYSFMTKYNRYSKDAAHAAKFINSNVVIVDNKLKLDNKKAQLVVNYEGLIRDKILNNFYTAYLELSELPDSKPSFNEVLNLAKLKLKEQLKFNDINFDVKNFNLRNTKGENFEKSLYYLLTNEFEDYETGKPLIIFDSIAKDYFKEILEFGDNELPLADIDDWSSINTHKLSNQTNINLSFVRNSSNNEFWPLTKVKLLLEEVYLIAKNNYGLDISITSEDSNKPSIENVLEEIKNNNSELSKVAEDVHKFLFSGPTSLKNRMLNGNHYAKSVLTSIHKDFKNYTYAPAINGTGLGIVTLTSQPADKMLFMDLKNEFRSNLLRHLYKIVNNKYEPVNNIQDILTSITGLGEPDYVYTINKNGNIEIKFQHNNKEGKLVLNLSSSYNFRTSINNLIREAAKNKDIVNNALLDWVDSLVSGLFPNLPPSATRSFITSNNHVFTLLNYIAKTHLAKDTTSIKKNIEKVYLNNVFNNHSYVEDKQINFIDYSSLHTIISDYYNKIDYLLLSKRPKIYNSKGEPMITKLNRNTSFDRMAILKSYYNKSKVNEDYKGFDEQEQIEFKNNLFYNQDYAGNYNIIDLVIMNKVVNGNNSKQFLDLTPKEQTKFWFSHWKQQNDVESSVVKFYLPLLTNSDKSIQYAAHVSKIKYSVLDNSFKDELNAVHTAVGFFEAYTKPKINIVLNEVSNLNGYSELFGDYSFNEDDYYSSMVDLYKRLTSLLNNNNIDIKEWMLKSRFVKDVDYSIVKDSATNKPKIVLPESTKLSDPKLGDYLRFYKSPGSYTYYLLSGNKEFGKDTEYYLDKIKTIFDKINSNENISEKGIIFNEYDTLVERYGSNFIEFDNDNKYNSEFITFLLDYHFTSMPVDTILGSNPILFNKFSGNIDISAVEAAKRGIASKTSAMNPIMVNKYNKVALVKDFKMKDINEKFPDDISEYLNNNNITPLTIDVHNKIIHDSLNEPGSYDNIDELFNAQGVTSPEFMRALDIGSGGSGLFSANTKALELNNKKFGHYGRMGLDKFSLMELSMPLLLNSGIFGWTVFKNMLGNQYDTWSDIASNVLDYYISEGIEDISVLESGDFNDRIFFELLNSGKLSEYLNSSTNYFVPLSGSKININSVNTLEKEAFKTIDRPSSELGLVLPLSTNIEKPRMMAATQTNYIFTPMFDNFKHTEDTYKILYKRSKTNEEILDNEIYVDILNNLPNDNKIKTKLIKNKHVTTDIDNNKIVSISSKGKQILKAAIQKGKIKSEHIGKIFRTKVKNILEMINTGDTALALADMGVAGDHPVLKYTMLGAISSMIRRRIAERESKGARYVLCTFDKLFRTVSILDEDNNIIYKGSVTGASRFTKKGQPLVNKVILYRDGSGKLTETEFSFANLSNLFKQKADIIAPFFIKPVQGYKLKYQSLDYTGLEARNAGEVTFGETKFIIPKGKIYDQKFLETFLNATSRYSYDIEAKNFVDTAINTLDLRNTPMEAGISRKYLTKFRIPGQYDVGNILYHDDPNRLLLSFQLDYIFNSLNKIINTDIKDIKTSDLINEVLESVNLIDNDILILNEQTTDKTTLSYFLSKYYNRFYKNDPVIGNRYVNKYIKPSVAIGEHIVESLANDGVKNINLKLVKLLIWGHDLVNVLEPKSVNEAVNNNPFELAINLLKSINNIPISDKEETTLREYLAAINNYLDGKEDYNALLDDSINEAKIALTALTLGRIAPINNNIETLNYMLEPDDVNKGAILLTKLNKSIFIDKFKLKPEDIIITQDKEITTNNEFITSAIDNYNKSDGSKFLFNQIERFLNNIKRTNNFTTLKQNFDGLKELINLVNQATGNNVENLKTNILNELISQDTNIFDKFNKELDLWVIRIPVTGYNSMQHSRPAFFVDHMDNTFVAPSYLLTTSGADNDGDQVSVVHYNTGTSIDDTIDRILFNKAIAKLKDPKNLRYMYDPISASGLDIFFKGLPKDKRMYSKYHFVSNNIVNENNQAGAATIGVVVKYAQSYYNLIKDYKTGKLNPDIDLRLFNSDYKSILGYKGINNVTEFHTIGPVKKIENLSPSSNLYTVYEIFKLLNDKVSNVSELSAKTVDILNSLNISLDKDGKLSNVDKLKLAEHEYSPFVFAHEIDSINKEPYIFITKLSGEIEIWEPGYVSIPKIIDELSQASLDNPKDARLAPLGIVKSTWPLMDGGLFLGLHKDKLFKLLQHPLIQEAVNEIKLSNDLFKDRSKNIRLSDYLMSKYNQVAENKNKINEDTLNNMMLKNTITEVSSFVLDQESSLFSNEFNSIKAKILSKKDITLEDCLDIYSYYNLFNYIETVFKANNADSIESLDNPDDVVKSKLNMLTNYLTSNNVTTIDGVPITDISDIDKLITTANNIHIRTVESNFMKNMNISNINSKIALLQEIISNNKTNTYLDIAINPNSNDDATSSYLEGFYREALFLTLVGEQVENLRELNNLTTRGVKTRLSKNEALISQLLKTLGYYNPNVILGLKTAINQLYVPSKKEAEDIMIKQNPKLSGKELSKAADDYINERKKAVAEAVKATDGIINPRLFVVNNPLIMTVLKSFLKDFEYKSLITSGYNELVYDSKSKLKEINSENNKEQNIKEILSTEDTLNAAMFLSSYYDSKGNIVPPWRIANVTHKNDLKLNNNKIINFLPKEVTDNLNMLLGVNNKDQNIYNLVNDIINFDYAYSNYVQFDKNNNNIAKFVTYLKSLDTNNPATIFAKQINIRTNQDGTTSIRLANFENMTEEEKIFSKSLYNRLSDKLEYTELKDYILGVILSEIIFMQAVSRDHMSLRKGGFTEVLDSDKHSRYSDFLYKYLDFIKDIELNYSNELDSIKNTLDALYFSKLLGANPLLMPEFEYNKEGNTYYKYNNLDELDESFNIEIEDDYYEDLDYYDLDDSFDLANDEDGEFEIDYDTSGYEVIPLNNIKFSNKDFAAPYIRLNRYDPISKKSESKVYKKYVVAVESDKGNSGVLEFYVLQYNHPFNINPFLANYPTLSVPVARDTNKDNVKAYATRVQEQINKLISEFKKELDKSPGSRDMEKSILYSYMGSQSFGTAKKAIYNNYMKEDAKKGEYLEMLLKSNMSPIRGHSYEWDLLPQLKDATTTISKEDLNKNSSKLC